MICHTWIPNEKGWLRSNNCILLCSVTTFKCRLTAKDCAWAVHAHKYSEHMQAVKLCWRVKFAPLPPSHPTIKICKCIYVSAHWGFNLHDWDETCTMGHPGHSYAQVYSGQSYTKVHDLFPTFWCWGPCNFKPAALLRDGWQLVGPVLNPTGCHPDSFKTF